MSNPTTNMSQVDLDRERVTCLLIINTQLMKKAVNIYHNVLSNQQSLQQLPDSTRQTIMDSYQNCTRRIHCNLSVLSHLHEKYHGNPSQIQQSQNKPSFPIIVSAPQDMPELNHLYAKLQELYPEALQFLKLKIQQMRKQSQFQQGNTPTQGSNQSHSISSSQVNMPNKIMMANNSPVVMNNSPNFQIGPSNTANPNSNVQNFNTNFNIPSNNFPSRQIHQAQPEFQQQQTNQVQPQSQSISPQQIFQQMNGAGPNNNAAGMMEFFN